MTRTRRTRTYTTPRRALPPDLRPRPTTSTVTTLTRILSWPLNTHQNHHTSPTASAHTTQHTTTHHNFGSSSSNHPSASTTLNYTTLTIHNPHTSSALPTTLPDHTDEGANTGKKDTAATAPCAPTTTTQNSSRRYYAVHSYAGNDAGPTATTSTAHAQQTSQAASGSHHLTNTHTHTRPTTPKHEHPTRNHPHAPHARSGYASTQPP